MNKMIGLGSSLFSAFLMSIWFVMTSFLQDVPTEVKIVSDSAVRWVNKFNLSILFPCLIDKFNLSCFFFSVKMSRIKFWVFVLPYKSISIFFAFYIQIGIFILMPLLIICNCYFGVFGDECKIPEASTEHIIVAIISGLMTVASHFLMTKASAKTANLANIDTGCPYFYTTDLL